MVALICADAEVVYYLFVAKGKEFEEGEMLDKFEYGNENRAGR
tara:strand:+ start:6335 stop:6463 length:129 start_codon:yes stop_codon:yes gene_type:complete